MAAYRFLTDSCIKFAGGLDADIAYITDWQLKDRQLWKKFVNQFRLHSDSREADWRGEFWGKMMRGACLTWQYSHDPELYEILEETARDLLTAQDELGRICTYTVETEFHGWDMWCRKYVLTGMQHFYDICKDEMLKQEIVNALCRHADYIISKIGPGKADITKTSTFWGGINSCSILEPVVRLYTMTGRPEYLEFARYILSTGGCADGNMLQTALEGRKLPHEFPTVKAYETMSFFEGALAYYEVTGEEQYFTAVEKFVRLVMEHEISVIGCAGCEHELFDNTAKTQTTSECLLQQETCVTVTWMRLLSRLALLTGDAAYFHAFELPAYNAMPGAVNYEKQNGFDYWVSKKPTEPLPFDSYSPLKNNTRGQGTGGVRVFEEGGIYGCCACIGSAGLALRPLTAFLAFADGFVVNDYYAGAVDTHTPQGSPVRFVAETAYPRENTYQLKLCMQSAERFTLRLRIPAWCREARIQVGAESYTAAAGFFDISRQWQDGDCVCITFSIELRTVEQDGLTAWFYGPVTLCRDDLKSDAIAAAKNGQHLPLQGRELLRMAVETKDGLTLLTDYASCGKFWNQKNARIDVWM